MEEKVDLVDSRDKKIGVITKTEAHLKGLRHRAVHILVFNFDGKIFLQHRAKTKLLVPNVWDSSVGEHVKAGESYEKAAIRGLKEELGIRKTNAKKLFKMSLVYKEKNIENREFVAVFETRYDGKITTNREFDDEKWFSMKELERLIKAKPKKFGPFLIRILKKLKKMKKL